MKKLSIVFFFILAAFSQAKAIYFDDDATIEQGYRGFVEWDYTLGVGNASIDRISISTSHGYQIAPQFFIGAGASFSYYYDYEAYGIPLYVHMRSDLLNNEITPYIDLKVGYSIGDSEGIYLNPSIGCRFSLTENLGLSVGVGYTFNKVDIYKIAYKDYDFNIAPFKQNIGGINFRIGIDF